MKTKVILTTCSSEDEARSLALSLLKARLVACAQVIPKIRSLYWWEGKIEESEEFLLLLKSSDERLKELEQENRRLKGLVADQSLDIQILKEYNRVIEEGKV